MTNKEREQKRKEESHKFTLMKASLYRNKRREEAKITNTRITTDMLEAELPDRLKINLPNIRKEYLKIHITKRPPYEAFLKMKINEYIKQTNT
jgi:hypothetical protein